jgi:pimeloyl-ACP methyl ester carboxylesterase
VSHSRHFIPCSLPWGSGSQAQWSQDAAQTALVFVHGYNGRAAKTWMNFPGLLLDDARFARHDLIYYGYRSTALRADAIADDLSRFVNRLAEAPAMICNPTLPPSVARPREHRYTRIVVVAHSLGAVVTRLALLRAARRGVRWLGAVSMVLFAPAHLGADIISLAGQSIFGPVVPVAMWFSPVLKELKENSQMLQRLRNDTERAIQAAGTASHLVARRVVQAPRDTIVTNVRFCEDPDAEYVEASRTHQTVCKPSLSRPLPFELAAEFF